MNKLFFSQVAEQTFYFSLFTIHNPPQESNGTPHGQIRIPV